MPSQTQLDDPEENNISLSPERRAELSRVEQALVYSFKEIGLLEQSLIHKSYANEQRDNLRGDNERLEFLGDAVLDLAISYWITKRFPGYSEGDLSKLRAALVNEQSLAHLGQSLQLGDFLLLGKGEEKSGGRNKPSLLADAYEAVVAAIFLDSDLSTVMEVIKPHFHPFLEQEEREELSYDHKTQLQEFAQSVFKEPPLYRLVAEYGPDHDKVFEVDIIINKTVYGTGVGKSKKEAEQQAASQALEMLQKE